MRDADSREGGTNIFYMKADEIKKSLPKGKRKNAIYHLRLRAASAFFLRFTLGFS